MSWTPQTPNWPADAGASVFTPPGGADAQPTYTGSGALTLQDFGVSNVTPDQLQNFSRAPRSQNYFDSQGNQYNSDGQIVVINKPNGQYNVDPNTGVISNYIAPSHGGGFFGDLFSGSNLGLLGLAAAAIFAPELLPEIAGVGGDATAAALGATDGLVTDAVAGGLAADAAGGDLAALSATAPLTAADYAAGQAATDAALANAGIDTSAAAAAAAAPAAATPATNTSLYDLANTQAAAPIAAPTVADTSTALTAPTAGTSLADMGGAQGIVAPSNFGTTAFAEQAPTSLAEMGGAQGITAGSAAGLAGMGGAQGITATNAALLGDASSFINDPAITGVGSTVPLANVSGAGVTPVGSTVLGDPNSFINAGTAATVGATAPVSSALSPAVTDGTAAATGLASGLTPAQLAALGGAAAQALGGINTGNAISSAQAQQAAAAAKAQDTLSGIYSGLNQQIAPYQQTGQQGLTGLQNNLGYFQNQFNNQDLNAQLAPNYGFMLQQGQMANQRAANVGGGALSGNTLQGLNQYTQNYAQNAYQNAFNNYQTQRTGIYNTLAGIAGLGTSANQQAVTAGSQYGNQATNLATGIAAAQAGATVGQAQNTSNTLSNLTNNLTLASLLGQKTS